MSGVIVRAGYRSEGFTIVELLIVVVVIAILAAISVVAYTGIQNNSHDSVIKNDLSQSAKKIHMFRVENDRYPSGTDYEINPVTQAEINSVIVATRASYWTVGNSFLYCRSDQHFSVIAKSRSGAGFYNGSTGFGKLEPWPGDGNANLCPAAGIPTGSSGYQYVWMYSGGGVNGYSWRSWFTGAR